MHWQDAARASSIGRAMKAYDKDRTIVRYCNGDCYLYYSDTEKFIGPLRDGARIEGHLDWLPDRRMYGPNWFIRLIRWIMRK